jgi:hypothetical protein
MVLFFFTSAPFYSHFFCNRVCFRIKKNPFLKSPLPATEKMDLISLKIKAVPTQVSKKRSAGKRTFFKKAFPPQNGLPTDSVTNFSVTGTPAGFTIIDKVTRIVSFPADTAGHFGIFDRFRKTVDRAGNFSFIRIGQQEQAEIQFALISHVPEVHIRQIKGTGIRRKRISR